MYHLSCFIFGLPDMKGLECLNSYDQQFSNINNQLLNSLKHKKTTTYAVGSPRSGLEQVQNCDRVKPVNGIPTLECSLKDLFNI